MRSMMQAKYGLEWLDVSRVFPAKGAGTEEGWFYRFPVVEVNTLLSHTSA